MKHRDEAPSKQRIPMLLVLIAAFTAACGDSRLGPEPASDTPAGAATVNRRSTEPPPRNVVGNSLPASWRPFHAGSPWNEPIPSDAPSHPDSDLILGTMASQARTLAFSRSYTIPVWVVDSNLVEPVVVRSDRIFDWWDTDLDGWSDVGVPLTRGMWPEQTDDAHLCIVDPRLGVAWEMSRFSWPEGGPPQCTTFNLWDLDGPGYGDPDEGNRWGARGGRGSGFPLIAGLLRPEEVEAGEIRHALVFTFSDVAQGVNGEAMFLQPPACRADGNSVGAQYPLEGMLFQLDPAADERDFDEWELTAEARVVARALQTYGMYLGDRGGDMKIQVQLLARNAGEHRRIWDDRCPGLYRAVERIPTDRLRVVYTGEPTIREH